MWILWIVALVSGAYALRGLKQMIWDGNVMVGPPQLAGLVFIVAVCAITA